MVIAIVVSLLAGFTIVVSRTINANLAVRTTMLYSTMWNYISGVLASVLLLLVLGFGGPSPFERGFPQEFWIFFGGGLGMAVIFISNVMVTRISSLNLTLLMFVGQIFTSVVLDWLLSGAFSLGNALGGLFVAAGMGFNLWVDADNQKKAAKRGG